MREAVRDFTRCPECGKKTWPSRQRAREIAARHPEGARVYAACFGEGFHVTTDDDAVRTAYFRDPKAVRVMEDIPEDVLAIIEPQIMDLRYSGATVEAIARLTGTHQSVINTILREHDPLAASHGETA